MLKISGFEDIGAAQALEFPVLLEEDQLAALADRLKPLLNAERV